MMLLAKKWRVPLSVVLRLLVIAVAAQLLALPASAALQLERAIEIAQQNDPWIQGNRLRQEALEAQSTAAGTLPDPMVNIGLANMPTDSFEFNQEPMTQFKVGIAQTLPRGDSLALSRRQLALMGSQHPYQRDERRAGVAVDVTRLWLEAFGAERSIQLIEDNRELFENLVDVAQSSYAAAMGRTRQQDLVRAQLELTRLDDRLSMLHERLEMSRARLGEWLAGDATTDDGPWQYGAAQQFELPGELPDLVLENPQLFDQRRSPSTQEIASHILDHPAILNLDTRIDASETGVALAKQKYKPQWTVNASYGYRDNPPSGADRPDFLSVGVAFDLPLFTDNRQDKQVQSAIASTEAIRTEKALALRNMVAAFEAQRARLLRLEERRRLYRTRLLSEMHEQAEASLTAYTNDDGDFAEVVRARIAELNAQIDALDIEVARLATISELNYFFAKSHTRATGESR
jgi:outer membrane protein TolC